MKMKTFFLVIFNFNLLFFTINVYAIDFEFKNPVPSGGTRTGYRTYGVYYDKSPIGYHTGIDIAPLTSGNHPNILSSNFGKRNNVWVNGNNDSGFGHALQVEHLITDGTYKYFLYGHLNEAAYEATYYAQNQLVSTMGATGNGYNRWLVHLHFEINDEPGLNNFGYLTVNRLSEYGYYDPDDFISGNTRPSVLIPCLSISEINSCMSYDVYGIAGDNLYGHLDINGNFNHSGILARKSFIRTDATQTSKTASPQFLAQEGRSSGSPISMNGISGATDNYQIGDYIFLAYVKDGNERRYGYPVKLTILPNDQCKIVDNDQLINGRYRYSQDLKDSDVNKVPGYFLSAQLIEGRSEATAQWAPDIEGKYAIFVHTPKGATATSVVYKIKPDGSSVIKSQPVDQTENQETWHQIIGENGETEFNFTKDGYIGLYAGNDSSTGWIALDAFKFVNVKTWNGIGSMICYHAKSIITDHTKRTQNDEHLYGLIKDRAIIQTSKDYMDMPVVFFQWQVDLAGCRNIKLDAPDLSNSEKKVDITIGTWEYRTDERTFSNVNLPFVIGLENIDLKFSESEWLVIKIAFRNPIYTETFVNANCTTEKPQRITPKKYIDTCLLKGGFKWNGNGSIISKNFQELKNSTNASYGCFRDIANIYPSSEKPILFFQWQVTNPGCESIHILKSDGQPSDENKLDITIGHWNTREYDYTFENVSLPFTISKNKCYFSFYDAEFYVIKLEYKNPVTKEVRVELRCDDFRKKSATNSSVPPARVAPKSSMPKASDAAPLIVSEVKLDKSKIIIEYPVNITYLVKGIDTKSTKIDIDFFHNNEFSSIQKDGNYNKTYRWIPRVSGENIYVRVRVKDDKGNVLSEAKSKSFNIIDNIDRQTELPSKTYLYTLGKSTYLDKVRISWRKILDSTYKHNADEYVIEYADNNDFTNSEIETDEPIVTGNLYESFDYTIYNLEDDTTYFFRVRGKNNAGKGEWSNVQSITIDIQDNPKQPELTEPKNKATGVSKSPILKWTAYDPDQDPLDYYVTLSLDKSEIEKRTIRSFGHATYNGVNQCNIEEEYRPLQPNTKYYWQIWVKEKGRYKDYYGGNYIKSDIWEFTTVSEGSDLKIADAVLSSDLLPDSDVYFKVTVRNDGTEKANKRRIEANYIKNSKNSPFWFCEGMMTKDLTPGETEVIDVKVTFSDDIFTSPSEVEYDNILIAGESKVEFYFGGRDEQDINPSNNKLEVSINYQDKGEPVIDNFDIRDIYGYSINNDYEKFTAKANHRLQIVIDAYDDILIKSALLEYDLSGQDEWQELEKVNDINSEEFYFNCDRELNHSCGSNYTNWTLPELETSNTRIRIKIYDSSGSVAELTSRAFSIVSSNVKASIEVINSPFQVGRELQFRIQNNSRNKIRSIKVYLEPGYKRIFQDFSEDGITFENQYSWEIPNQNSYASTVSSLKLVIEDVYHTEKRIQSKFFAIKPEGDLPVPFNDLITIYDNPITFPDNSDRPNQQIQEVKFVKIDDSNIVHTVVQHTTYYVENTGSGKMNDKLTFINKWLYITYSPVTDKISSPVVICSNEFDVIDFYLQAGIPYSLLQNRNYPSQYYYSYKNGSDFVNPINIINPNIPKIKSVTKKDEVSDPDQELSNPNLHLLLNNYIWVLDLSSTKIYRYSFNNGQIGDREKVNIQNNDGSLESSYIKPVTDGTNIYFVDTNRSKLVKVNTDNKTVEAYSLPDLDISDRDDYYKISMAIKNHKVFIFANGKVLTLESGSVVEKGNISYTFNNKSVDLTKSWYDVHTIKTVMYNNEIILLIDFSGTFYKAEPTWTPTEIIQFNPNNYSFTKKLMRTQDNLTGSTVVQELGNSGFRSNKYDIVHIGNSKILTALPYEYSTSDIHLYFCFLNMMDLETGEVNYIGRLPVFTDKNVSLFYENGQIYAIGENCTDEYNVKSECYNISLENATNSRVEECSYMKMVQYDKKLYLTWRGNIFDGTWDYENSQIKSYQNRKNKFIHLDSSPGQITNFYNTFLGSSEVNVSGNYLSFPYLGSIYSLNSNFTVKQHFYDDTKQNGRLIELLTYGAPIAGAFNFEKDTDLSEIKLISPDLSIINFDSESMENAVATYDDSVIVVGYHSNYHTVTKYDIRTGAVSEIKEFANTTGEKSTHLFDINKNKHVAIGWFNFLTVGDMSSDFIPPEISFKNEGGEITRDSTITLTWETIDSSDQLVKYELYTIDNDTQETLIKTIEDVSIKSYKYSLSESNSDEIVFKIIAYDQNNNSYISTTKTFSIVDPVELTSFYANGTSFRLGEKIFFTWEANGANQTTLYQLYFRKKGETQWIKHSEVINYLYKKIVYNKPGEYMFKLVSGNSEFELTHTIIIYSGVLLEFDADQFLPKNEVFDIGKVVDFKWGLKGAGINFLEFELYIKTDDDQEFSLIQSTTNLSYKHTFSDQTTHFDWKVATTYNGQTFTSQSYHVEFKMSDYPEMTISTTNSGVNQPVVEVSFSSVESVSKYALFRRDGSGTTEKIAETDQNFNSIIDSDIEYGEKYEYSVVPIIDDNIYQVQSFESVEIRSNSVQKVDILTQNPIHIETNQITIFYKPDPDDSYDNYEILTGKTLDTMQTYAITKERSMILENLEYDSFYFVHIYPLDNQDERILKTPAQLILSTGRGTYTITPTANENGEIIPSTPVTIEYGSNAGFIISPDDGFAIDDVQVNDASVGKVSVYTFDTISSDQTISASFIQNITSQKIPLVKGWNLISFSVNKCFYIGDKPVVPMIENIEYQQVDSIDTVLSSLNDQYSYVEGFDATGAKSYNKTIFSDMRYMAAGYGYWIKIDAEGPPLYLEIEGAPISDIKSIELHPGWNLVGYLGNKVRYVNNQPSVLFPESSGFQPVTNVDEIFNSIKGKYSYIEGFDSTGGKSYNLTPFSDLYYVGPGYGYWIKVESQENIQLLWE